MPKAGVCGSPVRAGALGLIAQFPAPLRGVVARGADEEPAALAPLRELFRPVLRSYEY